MMKRVLLILLIVIFLVGFSVVAFAVGETDTQSGSGIFSWVGDVANFIKRIFVPAPDYFQNQMKVVNDLANTKLGGVAQLYHILNQFFAGLKNISSANLSVSLPSGYFYEGYKGVNLDVLSSAQPYIGVLRSVLNVGACILTAVVCYHKLRTFFSES